MKKTSYLLRPATAECYPLLCDVLQPKDEPSYEQFCASIEEIAEHLSNEGEDCVVVDVTGPAMMQMLEDCGYDDSSRKASIQSFIRMKRSGLLRLESELIEAADAVGWHPTGKRQRQ